MPEWSGRETRARMFEDALIAWDDEDDPKIESINPLVIRPVTAYESED